MENDFHNRKDGHSGGHADHAAHIADEVPNGVDWSFGVNEVACALEEHLQAHLVRLAIFVARRLSHRAVQTGGHIVLEFAAGHVHGVVAVARIDVEKNI